MANVKVGLDSIVAVRKFVPSYLLCENCYESIDNVEG